MGQRPPATATQLHERGTDLELLGQRVTELGEGSGSIVLIEGRAGAGKTALLDAGIALGHAAGHDVRAVRAREHERPTSGATIGRLGLGNGADAVTFSRLVVGLAERGAAIVAVDDLHLADEESITALLGIAERIDDLPLVMMVTLRPGEWPREDLRLDRLRRSARTSAIRPAALSADAVGRVLEEHWGFAPSEETTAELTALTAGNPFLVTAVARG